LKEVVSYMDKQQASKRKVTKALTYPAIVLGMAVAVAFLMTMVVLPQMTLMFSSLNMELPLPTRILLGLTAFISSHQTEILASIGALVVAGVGMTLRPSGRAALQKGMLMAPLFGRVVLMTELARFSRTTSMLLHAGVSMTDVMEMAAKSAGNVVVSSAIRKVGSELMRGRPLAGAMAMQKVFTPALVQMVAVGEETGRLENTLATIAQAYETEADERTATLISFIEPAMTIFIALVVGFIALAVVMPMYSIIGSMG
ncbi:MAG: type II secretion system F family protein, partial [Dehalococcoidia bacterium]|nr:type II secretion system F family protein [Dehalococcoidia bacterium]